LYGVALPQGFDIIKEILHIVLVYLLWCFCIQYLVLNKWYQSTFLGQTLWANIGASFGVGYEVPKSSMGISHEHLDMDPGLTMVVGLLQHSGFHFYMGPWFFSLLQHYGPQLSMGPWYMVVHQALRTTLS
jgi:hypothetical protein